MQEILLYLAKAGPYDILLGNIGLLALRFLLTAFALYLCGQAVTNIPYAQKFTMQPYGRLVIFILLLVTGSLLVLWIPDLRILHEMGLVRRARSLVWLDIAFSALALVRMSYLIPGLLDWLKSQTG